ncbi:MAG TPA: hypothetical protein VI893_05945 [Thermoplasmata archaeon]|nr:hypothetical protein [Thermoplasmata archaeon]
MSLEKITVERAKTIAKKSGLKPARVKETEIIRFMKNRRPTLEEITWDDFEATLKKEKLGIFASGSWMKIMKDRK